MLRFEPSQIYFKNPKVCYSFVAFLLGGWAFDVGHEFTRYRNQFS